MYTVKGYEVNIEETTTHQEASILSKTGEQIKVSVDKAVKEELERVHGVDPLTVMIETIIEDLDD